MPRKGKSKAEKPVEEPVLFEVAERGEYKVKWWNYPDEECTWEPPESFVQCKEVLQKFWLAVSQFDNSDTDYYEGQEIHAPPSWIEQEKELYARSKVDENLCDSDPDDDVPLSTSTDSDDDDDLPLAPPPSSSQSRRRRPQNQEEHEEMSESDSADGPVKKRPKLQNGRGFILKIKDTNTTRSRRPEASPRRGKTRALSSSEHESEPYTSSSDLYPPPISTKKQLVQHALAVVAPSAQVPTNAQPVEKTDKKTLPRIPKLLRPSDADARSLRTPIGPTPRPPEEQRDRFFGREMVQSVRGGSPLGSSRNASKKAASPPPPNRLLEAADEFLRDVAPPQFFAPLDVNVQQPSLDLSLRLTKNLKALAPPPVSSSSGLKWTGPLTVQIANSADKIDFKVIIGQEVEIRPTRFNFSMVLPKQLEVGSLLDAEDLKTIFKACQRPAYWAQVTRDPVDENETAWKNLGALMTRRRQVAMIPLYMDGNHVAHLLLYPSRVQLLLDIPLTKGDGSLMAVILPWSLNPQQISGTDTWTSDTPTRSIRNWGPFANAQLQFDKIRDLLSSPVVKHDDAPVRTVEYGPAHWKTLVKLRPTYQLALRVLGFPEGIYRHLQRVQRYWGIYKGGAAGLSGHPGSLATLTSTKGTSPRAELESQLLASILNRVRLECDVSEMPEYQHLIKSEMVKKAEVERPGIRPVSGGNKPGIVFIHLEALGDLDQLSDFVELVKATKDSVEFYSFGTHQSYSSSFWGVRQIFPIGGVMTLAPSSLITAGTLGKLRAVIEHPFWTAYIVPSVVGMLATLAGVRDVEKAKSKSSLLAFLLAEISEGGIALLNAPPERGKNWPGVSKKTGQWMKEYMWAGAPSPQQALRWGIDAFESKYAGAPRAEWHALLEQEVVADLKAMQRNPAMIEDYRRFVVLTGEQRRQEGSVEWLTPDALELEL
ncbi:hypothetical protein CC1G_12844 [Coprinopsis cinerea okayama7|uniref:Chromo domain-containing protein n=1 Tax=Coprinopsis cinerea (strain Okayama-7 / 130 / ATCC MYA-4618 / FGSC 9003) TaxID=240176 RepID=A8NE13_COPC7|nr:hypothetical protein CC1G_12844 [Coprinopsis cinerea okayama7\|eukprot:XP_001832916.2 hypothetical protein CC1G_12844 [Coprinopsis cinerea okayama7\